MVLRFWNAHVSRSWQRLAPLDIRIDERPQGVLWRRVRRNVLISNKIWIVEPWPCNDEEHLRRIK